MVDTWVVFAFALSFDLVVGAFALSAARYAVICHGHPLKFVGVRDKRARTDWATAMFMLGLLVFGIARSVFVIGQFGMNPYPWWVVAADGFRVLTALLLFGAWRMPDK